MIFLTVGNVMEFEQVKFIHEYLVRFFENSEDPISPQALKI